jgi:hypothetical protein
MGECSTNGRDEKCIQNLDRKNLKVRHQSEDLGIDGGIILQWVLEK